MWYCPLHVQNANLILNFRFIQRIIVTLGFSDQLLKLAFIAPAIIINKMTAIFKRVKTEFKVDDSLTPIINITLELNFSNSISTNIYINELM